MNDRRDTPAASLPQPIWAERLHAQGRSISWLARELGVSRSYLAAVASGQRTASAELATRIEAAVAHGDRLEPVREYADQRTALLQARDALEVALRVIDRGLGRSDR